MIKQQVLMNGNVNERDDDQELWDEAYDWAYQRANEEGDVDLNYDDDLIAHWAEEYYDYMKGLK